MESYFNIHNDVESELIFGNRNDDIKILSIVIPTFNRKDLLEKTLYSIINQQKPDNITYQVIVVSNNPNYCIDDINFDLDPDIFLVYRNKSNIGMVGNMNRCAILSEGKYISYIQDDDVLLDNYLVTIEKLLKSNMLNNVDCLIPNRFFYYDSNDKDSLFGAKANRKSKIKQLVQKVISIGTKKHLFQRVDFTDCAKTWYNCFSGGPTCGILFNRSSLISTKGFDETYPFSFDFVFFIDYSKNNNVVLYNEYLSVYRMTNSASNRSEVQCDFFRSDMYLLEKSINNSDFIKFFYKEIIKFSYENKSKESQKLIKCNEFKKNIYFKYIIYRIIRFVRLMRSNVYRRELLPQKYFNCL